MYRVLLCCFLLTSVPLAPKLGCRRPVLGFRLATRTETERCRDTANPVLLHFGAALTVPPLSQTILAAVIARYPYEPRTPRKNILRVLTVVSTLSQPVSARKS